MKDIPIDFVITWVNGSDPDWLNEKKKYERNLSDSDDNREVRYRDMELLKYWFRAVDKYAPWVNQVHFVTWGHLPDWLNEDCPKLHITRHRDYIPEEYLPTYSSHVIELNFHRIKGLSEQFVYFNDDMFITDYVTPEDFFVDGKPCDELREINVYNYDPTEIFPHILFNNMGFINRHFMRPDCDPNRKYGYLEKPIYTGFKDFHLSCNLLKSTFEQVWGAEESYLDYVCRHKFHTAMDVNFWIVRYWQLLQNNYHPINFDEFGRYFTLSKNNSILYEAISNQKYKIICFNDIPNPRNPYDFHTKKQELAEVFQSILPMKSQFEK